MASYKAQDSLTAYKVTSQSAAGSYLSVAPKSKARRLKTAHRKAMRHRIALQRRALLERCAEAYAALQDKEDPTPAQMAKCLQALCLMDDDPCGAFRWASRGLARVPTTLFLVDENDRHLIEILAFALVEGNGNSAGERWAGGVPKPQQLRNAYELLNAAHLRCLTDDTLSEVETADDPQAAPAPVASAPALPEPQEAPAPVASTPTSAPALPEPQAAPAPVASTPTPVPALPEPQAASALVKRSWVDAANAQKKLPKPYTHGGVAGEIVYLKFDINKMVWRAAETTAIGYLPIDWDFVLA